MGTAEEKPEPDGAATADGPFETAVRAVLGLLLLALPLAWNDAVFDLYDGVKRALAHVAVSIALVIWVSSGPARGVLRVRASRLAGALAALLAVQAVSLFTALNVVEGLCELTNRALWLAALALSVHVVGRRTHLDVLVGAGLVGATLASCIGIAQSAGVSWEKLPQVAIPASVFGNKNMAAEYVLLWLPIGVYAMLSWSTPARRAAGAFALGITSAFVFLTGTRAAYVGAAVAVACLAAGVFALLRGAAPDLRRRLLLGLVGVLVSWVSVWVSIHAIHAGMAPEKRRYAFGDANSAMTLSTFSSNWRLVVWTNTLAMIKDNPVIGVGLGNWRFHYPRYHRRIAVDTDFNSHVQADTPHNDWVQTFAETGLVGVAALIVAVLALVLAFVGWFAADRAEEDRLAVLCILVSCVALGVDAVFSFPIAKAAPTFTLLVLVGAAEGLAGARRVFELRGPASAACAQGAATLALGVVVGQTAWLYGDYHFKVGLILYNEGRVLEAHESLAQAYRFRPFDPALGVFHGGITQELGKTDEALAINLRARRQHPNFTNVLNQLGNIYWKKGMQKEAEQAYQEVLAIHPDFPEALRNLGSLYIATGRIEEARPMLERLVEREPHDPVNQLDLGEVYRALKKRERSRETLEKLLRRWPDQPRALMALGHLSREEKRFDDAERLYRRSLEIAPGTPPRYFLATLMADRGRVNEAKALLAQAAKDEPANKLVADAIRKLESGPVRSPTATIPRAVDTVEGQLRERIALDPRSAPLHEELAEIYLRRGDWASAAAELQRTVEYNPRSAIAWAKLAKVAQRAGRSDESERLLKKGLESSPADFTLWNELGLIYQGRGDAPRALECFERAAATPSAPAEIWFNVGAQRARSGRTEEAITALKRFVAEWKGDPAFRGQAQSEIARLEALRKH